MKKWNPHAVLMEMENGIAALKNSLAASQKVKQSCHMIQNSTSRYIPKRNDNMSAQRPVHKCS